MKWGRVCPKHPELEGERHNGGNCPECVKVSKKAYNERTRGTRSAEMKKYRENNRDKILAMQADWRSRNMDHIRCKNLQRKGFTLQLFDHCVEVQGGVCAICGIEFAAIPSKQVHADHCHDTGLPRGVLCHHCNAGLGAFRDHADTLLRAVAYLKNPTLEQLA